MFEQVVAKLQVFMSLEFCRGLPKWDKKTSWYFLFQRYGATLFS